MSIAATPIRPSPCSRRACARWKAAPAARGTSSGMAAVAASLLCHLKTGDHVVSARALFGSCRYIVEDLLPRYGIETTLVDGRDLEAWQSGGQAQHARLLLRDADQSGARAGRYRSACRAIAKKAGALVVVDNVFATPLLQRPMQLGADIVVYSATKHIDGQGRCLGGVVLGSKEFVEEKLHNYLKHTGPSLSPFNAWVLLKGLETLPVRVERQCASAAAIADFLAERPEVARVYYPGRADHPQDALAKRQMAGGGPMVAFEVKGGKDAAFRFTERAPDHQDQQQSRRREEPRHPSRHHDASAAHARGARRARHFRQQRAAVDRARGCRRPHGRSRPGAFRPPTEAERRLARAQRVCHPFARR